MDSGGNGDDLLIPPGRDLDVLKLRSIILSAFAQDKAWVDIHGGDVGCFRADCGDGVGEKDIHFLTDEKRRRPPAGPTCRSSSKRS